MGETFNKIYIEKCFKAKDDVEYLRTYHKFGPEPALPYVLETGDFFYHPDMGEYAVKKIMRIDNAFVYSEDREAFPKEECTWIPTRDQLIKALRDTNYSIGDTSGLDEERILDKYKRAHNKKWNIQKREWE